MAGRTCKLDPSLKAPPRFSETLIVVEKHVYEQCFSTLKNAFCFSELAPLEGIRSGFSGTHGVSVGHGELGMIMYLHIA